jgi:hypothetical protein
MAQHPQDRRQGRAYVHRTARSDGSGSRTPFGLSRASRSSTNAIQPPQRSSMPRSRDASNIWPIGSLMGLPHGSAPVLSCGVGACRPFGSTQRHPDELLILRVYHQKRRPITE